MHDRTAEQQEPGVRHAVPQTDTAAGEAGLLPSLSNWGLVCVCVQGVCVWGVYRVCVCIQGVCVCIHRVCG